MPASFSQESVLWQQGYLRICGIDEVGKGSFAGPLVVAGVIYPAGMKLSFEVDDSKKLNPKTRQKLDPLIKNASKWTIVEVDVATIDRLGIAKACQLAYMQVLEKLDFDFVLIDAFWIDDLDRSKQKPITRGDQISASIASASIIAKVYRDQLMQKLADKFPDYDLDSNKGYGSASHRRAIGQYGLTIIHRKSFALSKYLK